MTDIEMRVKRVIGEQLGLVEKNINKDSSFEGDLNLDSLSFVELIMALEREFECTISDLMSEKFITVGIVIAYIEVVHKK